jgi:hypothetical protein
MLLVMLSAAAGCPDDDSDPDTNGSRGDLGKGHFVYECLGQNDAHCAADEDAFPQALAVGARFGLRFSVSSGATPSVISAAPDFAKAVRGGFAVQRAGDFAMLAVNGNREVVDLKHLRAAPVAGLRVRGDGALPVEEITLAVGEVRELIAEPVDALNSVLAGSLEYAWASSEPSRIALQTSSDVNRLRVRATGTGHAQLTVQAGERSAVLDVHVTGQAPDAGDDAGVAPPDAGQAGDAEAEDAAVFDDGGES